MSAASFDEAASFYQAVYANPNDDSAKLVLADVLIEAQDPRGEFIALQMQTKRSRKAQLKMERLLQRHGRSFLGPLADVVRPQGQRWDKGFLVGCRAELTGTLVDEPSWATVHSIELVSGSGPSVPLELLSPHMASLREVEKLPRNAVVPLFNHRDSLPLTSLAVDGPGVVSNWSEEEVKAVQEAKALSALRRLVLNVWWVSVDELSWLLEAPVFSRIRSLVLATQRLAVDVGQLQAQLLTRPKTPDSLILKGRHLELKLKADEGWSVMQLSIRVPMVDIIVADAERLLESIPARSLSRLDVLCDFSVTKEGLARLKSLLKRFPRLARVTCPRTSG